MNVVILGATGLVGQGVLHACLRDETVTRVTVICRRSPKVTHPKLAVLRHDDFADLRPLTGRLGHVDACYFCIGVPSAGLDEAAYSRVTHDYALAAADALLPLNRKLTFVYVSGASADSTEQSPVMWTRVKGRAENALLEYPFRTYIFRPGYIKPMYGARPRVRSARVVYAATSWLYPALRKAMPNRVTSTDAIGRAMVAVSTSDDTGKRVLDSGDINRLAGV
jgi:uncharacterized protein YbjT (DUF2867 family)